MLGDKISAKEAEDMGMIYKAIPVEEYEDTVQGLLKRLSTMPTKGLALTKKAFSESLSNTLAEQIAVENAAQITASETADYTEGVQAFLEKRKPQFKGK